MKTKLDAGKIATSAGTAMIITSGARMNPLVRNRSRRARHPVQALAPAGVRLENLDCRQPRTSRSPHHRRRCTEGFAIRQILARAPGCVRSKGTFFRGDTVAVLGPDGIEAARGLSAYDSSDAVMIAGKKSSDIPAILGYEARTAMIHRDDMAVTAKPD